MDAGSNASQSLLIARDSGASIDLSPIRGLIERIRESYHPLQIWLFGSRARGTARPNSDWDILVVVPDSAADEKLDPRFGWRLQQGTGVYADVVPWPLSDFESLRDVVNSLPYGAVREGLRIDGG